MQSLCILGRQPALGLAELESLFGAEKLQPLGQEAALINIEPSEINFGRLGGTLKIAKRLTNIPSTNWQDIETYLIEHLPKHVCCIPEGKLVLGLSAYGLSVRPATINATGLKLKKVVRASGRPVRIVPNPGVTFSTAQVLYNKLFTSHNWELLLVRHDEQTYLAQTVAVQDINAYAARDQARPKRDARVGMLPPKLAQIVINLATGPLAIDSKNTVLDPFCGTGVILQEAALMGYSTYGTDIDPRMVEYTTENLQWLSQAVSIHLPTVQVGDATNFRWLPGSATVASETYLGRPLNSLPSSAQLREIINDCNTILKKFLINIAFQTPVGLRLCLAIPAWKTASGFDHLPLLDHLGDLGYNRVSFVHVPNNSLIYHREGQVVGRELVVITRK